MNHTRTAASNLQLNSGHPPDRTGLPIDFQKKTPMSVDSIGQIGYGYRFFLSCSVSLSYLYGKVHGPLSH